MFDQRAEKARLGARLRAARERAHVTVEEAASAANVQPLAVERWEKGRALPSLVEFRELLPLYGVMACEILFDANPWELTADHMAELGRAAKGFSPSLRARVDCLLAMVAQAKEPVWKVKVD